MFLRLYVTSSYYHVKIIIDTIHLHITTHHYYLHIVAYIVLLQARTDCYYNCYNDRYYLILYILLLLTLVCGDGETWIGF